MLRTSWVTITWRHDSVMFVCLLNCNHTTAELESRSNITALLFPMLHVMLNTTQSTCMFLLMIFFSRAQLLGKLILSYDYSTFAFPADTTRFIFYLFIYFFELRRAFSRLSVLAFLCLHFSRLLPKISSNTRLLAARDTCIVVVWDWFDNGLIVKASPLDS